jgi:hypothetical protein
MTKLRRYLDTEIEKERLNLKKAKETNNIEGVEVSKKRLGNLEKALKLDSVYMWD